MKNLLKILLVLILVISMITVTACNKNNDDKKGDNTNVGEKCTVSFEGTSLNAISVDKDSLIQRPSDPADTASSQFVNWYTDASYTTPATFPMTVNSDTKLYAKYISFKDYFLMARENTVGEGVAGFEYNYNWNISGNVSAVSVVGIQEGTSKYSSTNQVSYFDHHTNSGLLFNDGQIYEYKNGQTKNRIELDENGKIVDFSSETSTETQKYASSGFAKALFTYTNDDIKSVKKDGNGYLIKTKANVSSVGNIILNNINNPIVEKVLNTSLPNTESEASVKVTYADEKISSYEYNFTINVSAVTLQIKYTMDFKNINGIPQIDLPVFDDFYISANEVNECLATINNSINEFKNTSVTSNTFELKTAVDFGISASAIDATIKGESKRSNDSINVDYINLVEVDSDLKNSDLYSETGLEDIKFIRGNTSDGQVYDRVKKLIGYDDAVLADLNGRGSIDAYYLLLGSDFFNTNNVNSVSISTKENNSVYSLTLTKAGAFALFDYVNKYATLNPFIDADIKILGDYDKNDFNISEVSISIVVDKTTNALVSVDVALEGKTNVKYVGSSDFDTANRASISIELSFDVTNTVDSYSAPENKSDLKY